MDGRALLGTRIWFVAVGIGFLGLVGTAVRGGTPGLVMVAVASVFLLLRAAWMMGIRRFGSRLVVLLSGAALIVVGLVLFHRPGSGGPRLGAGLAVVGLQLVMLALGMAPGVRARGRHFGRHVFVFVGHLGLVSASWSLFMGARPFDLGTTLSLLGGMLILTLHAHWNHRQRSIGTAGQTFGSGDGLILGPALVLVLAFTAVAAFVSPSTVAQSTLQTAILTFAGLGIFAFLARPERGESSVGLKEGGMALFFFRSLAIVAILNLQLLVLFLMWPWMDLPVLLAFMAWFGLAVLFEYAGAWHAFRTRDRYQASAPQVDVVGVTAVIAAANEEVRIAGCIEAAAKLPGVERVVVVVAAASTDRTLDEARQAAQRVPGRVEVLVGHGGSKALDLNQAWVRVQTPVVLVLDADEATDAEGLRWAFSILEAQPRVGVVQGRKVRPGRARSVPARLAGAERRYSTLVDQVFQADVFGAAHFAGSAALLRREAPLDAGGWSDVALTEDIELTMRLLRATRLRVVYEPRFVVSEQGPSSWPSLVRQRSRWARGWAQVYRIHLIPLMRDARRLGARRTSGLLWQFLASASAPWSIFTPALILLFFVGHVSPIPFLASIILSVVILPSRFVAYAYADVLEPHGLGQRRWGRWVVAGLLGYVWLVLGWLLQLQALYLEIGGAPSRWLPTRAVGRPVDPPPRAAA